MAAHGAFTLLTLAYGLDAAVDVAPWTVAADRVAYAAIALYGARLLVAGGRSAQAFLLNGLAAALASLAVVCFLARQGAHGDLRATEIDVYGSPVLLLLAIRGALALRALLNDQRRAAG